MPVMTRNGWSTQERSEENLKKEVKSLVQQLQGKNFEYVLEEGALKFFHLFKQTEIKEEKEVLEKSSNSVFDIILESVYEAVKEGRCFIEIFKEALRPKSIDINHYHEFVDVLFDLLEAAEGRKLREFFLENLRIVEEVPEVVKKISSIAMGKKKLTVGIDGFFVAFACDYASAENSNRYRRRIAHVESEGCSVERKYFYLPSKDVKGSDSVVLFFHDHKEIKEMWSKILRSKGLEIIEKADIVKAEEKKSSVIDDPSSPLLKGVVTNMAKLKVEERKSSVIDDPSLLLKEVVANVAKRDEACVTATYSC